MTSQPTTLFERLRAEHPATMQRVGMMVNNTAVQSLTIGNMGVSDDLTYLLDLFMSELGFPNDGNDAAYRHAYKLRRDMRGDRAPLYKRLLAASPELEKMVKQHIAKLALDVHTWDDDDELAVPMILAIRAFILRLGVDDIDPDPSMETQMHAFNVVQDMAEGRG